MNAFDQNFFFFPDESKERYLITIQIGDSGILIASAEEVNPLVEFNDSELSGLSDASQFVKISPVKDNNWVIGFTDGISDFLGEAYHSSISDSASTIKEVFASNKNLPLDVGDIINKLEQKVKAHASYSPSPDHLDDCALFVFEIPKIN